MGTERRILIWNSNSGRDILGLLILENALKEKGFRTLICNEDQLKMRLLTFKPHGIISARGDNPIVRQASQVCKVFVVPGEGAQQTRETVPSIFMGRDYFKLDSVSWLSKCYLWGAPTREWLLETKMFREDQLKVAGNVRLDIYRNQALIKKLKKEKSKTFTLGVAVSAKSTSTYYGSPRYAEVYFNFHPQNRFSYTQPGRHFEDICWRDHAILRLTMRYVRRFLETTRCNVIFRPSPFEDPKEYKFLEKLYPERIQVLPRQPLPEFLCQTDALLTCWSTTGLESLLLQQPVISIAGTMDQEHLFRHISPTASGFESYVPFYHQPKSEDELFKMLEFAQQGILPVTPKQDQLAGLLTDIYNWPGGEASSQLIANDLVKELSDVEDASEAKWRQAISMKVKLPTFALPSAFWMKNNYHYWKSGAFANYHNFRKNTDDQVEKLLEKARNCES